MNEAAVKNIKAVSFEHFAEKAEITYDPRWSEWHLRYFEFEYFHFFNRSLAADQKEALLEAAYRHLQTIAAHDGEMNVNGVFKKTAEITVVETAERIKGILRIGYSRILQRWFFGFTYDSGGGGGGSACSFGCNPEVNSAFSAVSEGEILVKGAEFLHQFFQKQRLKETVLEKVLAQIEAFLSRTASAHHLSSTVLSSRGVAVQGSLF